jgi:short subunit dehydrogenase-like uncharacterized protein
MEPNSGDDESDGDDGDTLLVYGSYGYTGRLIVERALDGDDGPGPEELVLAGRTPEKLEAQAARHDVDARAFTLDHPGIVRRRVADADVVLNCAGPFERTQEPLVDACIATGTHYLDITGEIEVFQAVAARDEEARTAGSVLMPGVGFDVVPTDCLAAHLAEALPGADHLALSVDSLGRPSAGTLKTMVRGMGDASAVREAGRIRRVPLGSRTRTVDFGDGGRTAVAFPAGDVSTAYRTTGIENVEFYAPVPPSALRWLRAARGSSWLLTPPVKYLLESIVDAAVDGPDEDDLRRGQSVVWGEVTDGEETYEALLRTPNAYALTAATALESARRVLAGEVDPGYHTPAGAFGPDYALTFDGVDRRDARRVDSAPQA